MIDIKAKPYQPPKFENNRLVVDLRGWLASDKGKKVLTELADSDASEEIT